MRRQKKTKISPKWIYDIEEEYKPNTSIFDNDEEEVKKIKYIIFNKLSETDKRIILSYSELGNIRETSKLFKVSPTTIWNRIKEIKKAIINQL